MTGFMQFCDRLSPLDKAASDALLTRLKSRTVPAGDHLLKSGRICQHIFFIDQGLTKTYFTREDKEFIMKFFPENAMFTVLDSYILQTPSTYTILALEETTVTYIEKSDLDELCKAFHGMETFQRKLFSIASVNMMKRISEMLEENATARYNHFLKDYGPLLQRISLGDLAAYLGITQVSLSRIRAQK
jgi:CRP-like cAMP-binding protein